MNLVKSLKVNADAHSSSAREQVESSMIMLLNSMAWLSGYWLVVGSKGTRGHIVEGR